MPFSSSMLVSLSEPIACEIDIPVQADLNRDKRLMETSPIASSRKMKMMDVSL